MPKAKKSSKPEHYQKTFLTGYQKCDCENGSTGSRSTGTEPEYIADSTNVGTEISHEFLILIPYNVLFFIMNTLSVKMGTKLFPVTIMNAFNPFKF